MHVPRVRSRLMVLLAPWWRRRCSCGVIWPCDEAVRDRLRRQSVLIRNDRTGAWTTGPTPASLSPAANPAPQWPMSGSRR